MKRVKENERRLSEDSFRVSFRRTKRKTYQRGDSKGIDTYDMNIYKSGNYIIADIAGSATLKIDTHNDLKFVVLSYIEDVSPLR